MVRHLHTRNADEEAVSMMLRDVATMGKLVLELMQQTLDCYTRLDAELAEQIAGGRNELEMEFQSGVRRMITFILEDAQNVGLVISVVTLIHDLSRIGEHARNMAEYVIYLVSGEDVRDREHDADIDTQQLSDIL